MMNSQGDSAQRDPSLDGLRAIAVLCVVGCHLSKLCLHWNLTSDDFWEGACGAHLLLIASGFAMASVVASGVDFRTFCVARISKIYPLYAFAIIVSTGLIAFASPPLYQVTANQMLANLTMCQSWLGEADLDGAYWLTGVLLKFYVVVGLAVLLLSQRRRNCTRGCEHTIAQPVEFFTFSYLWLAFMVKVTPLSLFVPSIVAGLLNIEHAHLLIAGMLLWIIRSKGNSMIRSTAYFSCIGLELIGTSAPLGSIVIVGILIGCFFRQHLSFLAWQPLRYIGEHLSFGIYMLHGVLGYVAIDFIAHLRTLSRFLCCRGSLPRLSRRNLLTAS